MSAFVRVEELPVRRDGRGWVAEPLDPPRIPVQRNVHLAWTLPGAVRGNHWHRHGTEVLTVAGPALVRTRRDGLDSDIHVPEGAVYRITIPPGVAHAVKNTGSTPSPLVAFSTWPHDAGDPDVVREEVLEADPG